MEDIIIQELRESVEVKKATESLVGEIAEAAQAVIDALKAGSKVILFGNGGSAADTQHIACELVGRFGRERPALPAVALTTDTSVLTAVGNDTGFENIFARQVEALAKAGDVAIAISTSGSSPDVLKAVEVAREKGCKVVGFTGKNGKKLADLADLAVVIPSDETPRIQEAHITIGHIICRLVEEEIFGKKK
ncbi:MAG: D-sedoheptulose 7-phosphate isomerase [Actinomycetota bacterium]|nr:D-sedoheptulose 7-phosphate isomerase [Actinomycetota bacterium]